MEGFIESKDRLCVGHFKGSLEGGCRTFVREMIESMYVSFERVCRAFGGLF